MTDKENKELMAIEDSNTTGNLLKIAIEKMQPGEGAETFVGVVKELVELDYKINQRNAEKEFNDALSAFQQECPPILKSKIIPYASSAGGKADIKYAPTEDIMKEVAPLLYPKGFSISWDTQNEEMGGKIFIKATVWLKHRNGHKEKSDFSLPVPDKIGGMGEPHRYGSIRTYAIRYALVDALGIVTADEDTDATDPTRISKEQIAEIRGKVISLGLDKQKFFDWLDIDDYAEIYVSQLKKIEMAFKKKEREQERKDKPKDDGGLGL
jgi:hypothetical protein